MSPEEMAGRVTTVFERGLTSTVNDIEHIESTSYNGVSVIRIFLPAQCEDRSGDRAGGGYLPAHPAHPSARNVSARRDQIRRLQRAHSAAEPEQQDAQRAGTVRSRRQLHAHPARDHRRARPSRRRIGGKQRNIMVDLDPEAMYSHGLSATDVSNAVNQPEPDSSVRHGQDGRPRVFRPAQQQPDHRAGPERSAGQDRQRRDGVHARCGAGARRLPGADQHRAGERPPRRR